MTAASLLCCCGGGFEPPACCLRRAVIEGCPTAGVFEMFGESPVLVAEDGDSEQLVAGQIGECGGGFTPRGVIRFSWNDVEFVLEPDPLVLVAPQGGTTFSAPLGPPVNWGWYNFSLNNPITWPPTWFGDIPFCGVSIPQQYTGNVTGNEIIVEPPVQNPVYKRGTTVFCDQEVSYYYRQYAQVTYSNVITDLSLPFGEYREAVRVSFDVNYEIRFEHKMLADRCLGGTDKIAQVLFRWGSFLFATVSTLRFQGFGYVRCGTDPDIFGGTFCIGEPLDICPYSIEWIDGQLAATDIPQTDLFRSTVIYTGTDQNIQFDALPSFRFTL